MLKGDRNLMKIMCELKRTPCAERVQDNCIAWLVLRDQEFGFELSWLPRNITCTPFHYLRLLTLMMVSVAGLAM